MRNSDVMISPVIVKPRRDEEIIRRADELIRKNLANNIAVSRIASALGYSTRRVRGIFRNVTGEGVKPYILRLRLERAKELLRETDLEIYEIAAATGFRSPAYFSSPSVSMACGSGNACRTAAT